MFFGFTLLPAGDFLEVTGAVAVRRDVHVFLLEPTRLDAGRRCGRAPPSYRCRSRSPAPGLRRHRRR